jgi:hypothetical protein
MIKHVISPGFEWLHAAKVHAPILFIQFSGFKYQSNTKTVAMQ